MNSPNLRLQRIEKLIQTVNDKKVLRLLYKAWNIETYRLFGRVG